ncbi:STP1 protein [Plasmodium ovale wallikeri]|uniref:STP1 protein n=1 Tax=Plasmodium ovale wallikeri TaxID=864142 RepID=A0A1A9APF2_PLAOA|nr:STP1 protein [Plasmodium ovale wallikeri]
MDKLKFTCNEINEASKKDTVKTLLPYKTPILYGALNIINEFKKNDDDGIDYKNLCNKLSKYAMSQKNCVRDVVTSKQKKFERGEWKNIIKDLVHTYERQDVKRLCYYEDDKDVSKKKYVLNIHDVFRKFCIQKKIRLQNKSDMDFDECNNYMSWLAEKKRGLQAIDPKYDYIREYQKYFNIHHNCNYPWLVQNTPDVSCSMLTKAKGVKKYKEGSTSGDNIPQSPVVTKVSSAEEKKDVSTVTEPVPEGKQDHAKAKPPDTSNEKGPKKITPTDDGNREGKNEPERIDTWLDGVPMYQSTLVLEPRSLPDPAPVPDPKYLQLENLLYSNNYFQGNIIPHKYSHSTNIESTKNSEIFGTYVDGEPTKTNITEPNNFIPSNVLYSERFAQLLRSQPFVELLHKKPFHHLLFSERFHSYLLSKERFTPPIIHSQEVPPAIPHTEFDVPKHKPIKTQVNFIPAELIIDPRITTDPAIPGPSHFRYPFMIYTLVFLTMSTAITIFYLLSNYTSFGLLFNKKKKKKRLKRQLEIKKIPEESRIFDKITNYSVNDMPYENKSHDDNNIYTKIKIQKSIINKNINLPKKKKNKRKAIIDIHMELLNEYKNDEWELNKNDFLQICLEEFIREQNKIYSNSESTSLVMKNISIQNTRENKMVPLEKLSERCRPIWEKFKSENAFKVLQNEWKKEEKEYLENIEQFENNILNENTKISYKEIKKEIWRRWMTKQAKFIGQFTQEKWFKSLVKQIEDVSDEYEMGEIKDDIFVLNTEKLDNINNKEELYKHDNCLFLIKVLTQIFMMVIEECIKEESPEKTELVLDNIIEKLNKEKHAKIESKNIHQENMNHKEYNETLETDTHKYKDSFKELMEAQFYSLGHLFNIIIVLFILIIVIFIGNRFQI